MECCEWGRLYGVVVCVVIVVVGIMHCVFPVCVRESTMGEVGSCGIHEGAVEAFSYAVLLGSVWGCGDVCYAPSCIFTTHVCGSVFFGIVGSEKRGVVSSGGFDCLEYSEYVRSNFTALFEEEYD